MNTKYHYVYKITNINPTTSKVFYIGCRSSNIEPELDNYYSSCKSLLDDIKKYGIQTFKKEILKVFTNRKDALSYEIELHNKYYVNSNNLFYNKAKQSSINFDTTGTLFIHDKNSIILMTCDEYKNQTELSYHTKNKAVVKDLNNNTYQVDINDPRFISGEFVGINKNKINVLDNNKQKKITLDEFYANKTQYKTQNNNKFPAKDKNGNTFLIEKNDPRLLTNECVSVHKNKIMAKDKLGNIKFVSKEDFIKFDLVGINKDIIKGSNNPNAKTIKIFDNLHNLKYTCKGNFKEICLNFNLPFSALKKSYLNNSIIEKPKYNGSELTLLYIGWYARIEL